MRKLRIAAVTIPAALLFATAATAIESTIYPGVGIWRIKLGMTKTQVARVLGRDAIVNAREGAYTELAWDFGSWTVGFRGGRAVQIATTLRAQRTPKRIGVGSTWHAVVSAHPGGRCAWNIRGSQSAPTGMWPEYLLARRDGSQTLFAFDSGNPDVVPTIREVTVRTSFRPLREFSSSWYLRCDGDWRHADRPGAKAIHP